MSDGPRDRLAPVREARDRDARLRRGELAASAEDARTTQAAVDAATRRLDAARAALARAGSDRAALVDAGRAPTALALARADAFLQRLRRDVEAAADAVARARACHGGQLAHVEVARARYARARADREVLERHLERRRRELTKRADRRTD